jgi:hypothetical protein
MVKHEKTCSNNQHAIISLVFDIFDFLAQDVIDLLKTVQRIILYRSKYRGIIHLSPTRSIGPLTQVIGAQERLSHKTSPTTLHNLSTTPPTLPHEGSWNLRITVTHPTTLEEIMGSWDRWKLPFLAL